jgi:predicted nucleic acid-binding protein
MLAAMAKGYMLDTTVFNHVLRDGMDAQTLPAQGQLFVTHVQLNELQATKDPNKRAQLLAVFATAPSQRVPTESAMWDVSEWDEAKWGTDDDLFEQMLGALNPRNGSKQNNSRDILIGETAIRREFCLVTDDADLSDVVRDFGGQPMRLQDFLAVGHGC